MISDTDVMIAGMLLWWLLESNCNMCKHRLSLSSHIDSLSFPFIIVKNLQEYEMSG